tara:strand:- start:272 stop:448 length:177 start_codon:yes stop_codon:yes gene_type:complete
MAIYQLVNYKGTSTLANIRKKGDATVPALLIPLNTENSDYQAYLKWIEDGNTPDPAED